MMKISQKTVKSISYWGRTVYNTALTRLLTNKEKMNFGFSLMEMMVVLLIISIIMAATAPMVAKKMTMDRRNGGSAWVYTSNNGNIGFNIVGNNVSAIIGAPEISGRPNGIVPRLIINGSNTQPALAFASGGIYTGQLTADGTNNSVGISNANITNGSVAFGMGQTIGSTNTIAIGNNITTTNNGEINVGGKFKYDGSKDITLGDNTDVVNIPGSMKLNGLTSTDNKQYLKYDNGNVVLRGDLIVDGSVIVKTRIGTGNQWNFAKLAVNTLGDAREIETDPIDDDEKDYARPLYKKYKSYFSTTSDKRLKNIGTKYTLSLEELKKLDIYNFTFKHDKTKSPHVGVMAQDLEKVFPNSVSTDQTGYLRIRWDEMFYAVINAVKELDTRLNDIVARVTNNTSEIQAMKAVISEQQKIIDELKQRFDEQNK